MSWRTFGCMDSATGVAETVDLRRLPPRFSILCRAYTAVGRLSCELSLEKSHVVANAQRFGI